MDAFIELARLSSSHGQLRTMANDKVSTEPHLRPEAAKVKQWVGE